MPSLNFVLPHWLYWGGLILFPLIAWYLIARQRRIGVPRGPSLFIAYMFWLFSGFLGMHRFYLRSAWGFVFIPVFLSVLYVNGQIADLREDVSRTHAAYETAHRDVESAKPVNGAVLSPQADDTLKKLQAAESDAARQRDDAQGRIDGKRSLARWLAIAMAAMLLLDAVLLPLAVRRRQQVETLKPIFKDEPEPPPVHGGGVGEDPTLAVHTRLTDAIDWLNGKAGEFVAYWAVIAVFVYYYEVIARYVFNSPTNWVHESMFLMFGMQYMISGAFAYRDDQHVRVDVIYVKFSRRGKAIADIVTSLFFFIFIGTMLWTGWRFASDAISVGEHSFTEWGIEYWPVKLMIPVGGLLILLQGISKLIKDVAIVARREA